MGEGSALHMAFGTHVLLHLSLASLCTQQATPTVLSTPLLWQVHGSRARWQHLTQRQVFTSVDQPKSALTHLHWPS